LPSRLVNETERFLHTRGFFLGFGIITGILTLFWVLKVFKVLLRKQLVDCIWVVKGKIDLIYIVNKVYFRLKPLVE
jgi:hypothetical protein